MENPEIMYEVRQGTDNVHGAEFENHTTTLSYLRCEILHRQWKQNNASGVRSYFVANNVDHVGAFDDIVVRVGYPDGGTYKTKMMFVQCKHFLDPNKGSLDKILNSEITKLFDSFVIVLRILDEGVVSWDKHNKKEVQKYLRKGINEGQWKAKIDKLKAIFKCSISDCEFFLYSNSKFDDGAPENAEKIRCENTDISSKILKNATGDLFHVKLKEKYISKITYENYKHFSVKDFEFLKKEFSKRFRIYVNQHDKTIKDIDQLIKPEIDRKEFLRLLKQEQQYIYQTAMSSALTENSYLTDILESFYTLKYQSRKMLEKFLVIPNSKSLFTNEAIQSLKRHLSSECATKISTPFLQLEKLKILQMFITEMKEENLFIYIKDAEDLDIFSTARKLMSYKHLKNILVCSEIANSFSKYNKEVNEIFLEINQISANQTTLIEFASDFSVETIQFIQNYKVMFQGLAVTLHNIFEQRWPQLVNENIILKIFRKEEVVISRHVLPPLDCYLQRKLKVKTLMPQRLSDDSELFLNINSEYKYFVLSEKRKNIPRRDAPLEWFICISEARKFMRTIEGEIRNDAIHLCSQCDGNIVLLYTFGEKNVNSDFIDINENEFVVSEMNKVSIITGPAGMGKSSTLLSLAHLYKRENKSHLVYFIELNRHLKELKAYKSGLDLHSRIEFVASNILNIEKHSLEHRLFIDACVNTGNVAIFFDAFDEISPDGEKYLTNLLESLEKSRISRIFVSSRPNYVNTLEKVFTINGIHISPFDKIDMKSFIFMFLENYTKETISEIEDFVNCILKLMEENNGLLDEFLSIPLQLKMLAEVYFEKFSEMNADEKMSFSLKIDICSLYNAFIEKLVERYLLEKKKLVLQDEEQIIAIRDTMRDASELVCKLMWPDINQTPIAEYSDAILKMCNQVGLITSTDPPVFLHRTYGEFLAANFFVKCVNNENKKFSAYVSFMCKNVLIGYQYREIRRFINAILCNLNPGTNDSHIINTDVKILVDEDCDKTSLHVAAQEMHAEIVKLLVRNDPSKINEIDRYGYTAVELACRSGCLKSVEILYLNNCVTNVMNVKRKTVLHCAVKGKNTDIIYLILEKDKTLLTKTNYNGETVFFEACIDDNIEAVMCFLKIDRRVVNIADDYGKLPIHYATKRGKIQIVKELLSHNSNLINIKNDKGLFPLHIACKKNRFEVAKYLLTQKSSVVSMKCGEKEETSLHFASRNGNVELMTLLLQHDQTLLNKRNSDEESPLLCALFQKQTEAAKFLLKFSNCVVNEGENPLTFAAGIGDVELMKDLLQLDQTLLNKCNLDKKSPLLCALRKRQTEAAKFLLTFFNCVVNEGENPLSFAAGIGDVELMKDLLQLDQTLLNKCNLDMKSPLLCALFQKQTEAAKFLLKFSNCVVNEEENPLIFAAIIGDVELMTLILERDQSLINKCNLGETPLFCALSYKNTTAAKFLLKFPNCPVGTGENPLNLAAEIGDVDILRKIHSLDCTLINKVGENCYKRHTPLICALKASNIEAAKYLLELPECSITVDTFENSPFHYAAKKGYVEIINLLLNKDRSLLLKQNNLEETALGYAIDFWKPEVARILLSCDEYIVEGNILQNELEGALKEKRSFEIMTMMLERNPTLINMRNSKELLPLDIACEYNNTKAVKYLLLRTDSTLILKGERNDSILHTAVKEGNLIIIKYIIKKCPTLFNQQDSHGCTALHYACKYNNTKIAKLLLNHINCQVDVYNDKQQNPLHFSSKRCNLELMMMILNRDISLLNIQNKKGQTPLHLTLLYRNEFGYSERIEMVEASKYLLSLNCLVNVKDVDGKTPLHLASENNDVEIVELLIERDETLLNLQDKDGCTPLYCALRSYEDDEYSKECIETVSFLLNFPECEINRADNNGDTPLLYVAINLYKDDNDKILSLLLQRDGLLINVKNNMGQTALHFAAGTCDYDGLKILLSHKECKANVQDINSDTPLHWCILGHCDDECMQCVLLLVIKHDSSLLNIKNQKGQTPLHKAVNTHKFEAVDLLVRLGADVNIKDNDNRTPLELASWLAPDVEYDFQKNGNRKIIETLCLQSAGTATTEPPSGLEEIE